MSVPCRLCCVILCEPQMKLGTEKGSGNSHAPARHELFVIMSSLGDWSLGDWSNLLLEILPEVHISSFHSYFQINSQGIGRVAKYFLWLLAIQKAQVQSRCWKDPLKKEMTTHSSILVWAIPWTGQPGGPQFLELQKIWTRLSN